VVKLDPASLAFNASGTPFSPVYNDVYHSTDSGPGQSRHVFLAGNGLPARWAHAPTFTVVETGFGLGLNFLVTWQAWRADPRRCQRLHFVAIEKHPFERAALATLHTRYPEFVPLAALLQSAWPQLVPGLHRRYFDNGRVTLTLACGDVAAVLPQLRLVADTFYLDGFAPKRNSEMWTPQVMKALARLAKNGATLATYTTARSVRVSLTDSGFAVEKRTGFGRKRTMLSACLAPRRPRKHEPPPAPQWPEKKALVIGAGLAGAAVAKHLATRDWRVAIIERHPQPAVEASGMPASIVHPHLSPDDCLLSQFTRAGFLYALDHWQALQAAGHNFGWQRCGVLQISDNNREESRMAQTLRTLGYPASYAQYLSRKKAGDLAGCRVAGGGWWFPDGGWLRAAELVAAQLAATQNLVTHFNTGVYALVYRNKRWTALASDGAIIATAPVVILANAHDATRLTEVGVTLQRIRGQLTIFATATLSKLPVVVGGGGYVIPTQSGVAIAGVSYDLDAEYATLHAAEHARNLEHVTRLLPDVMLRQSAVRGGGVGFRCVAPDRMPLIGALPNIAATHARAAELTGAQLADLPRLPGLYGAFGYASRGLTWAALGGELIASMIEGDPLPLGGALADAVDPGRFVLKQVRRGKLVPPNL